MLLTRSDTVALADLRACVEAVRAAFRADGQERSLGGTRVHLEALQGGAFHLTAGGIAERADAGTVGIKLNGRFPALSADGCQRLAGLVVLSDAATGVPVAVLDSMVVTSLRTSALTAVVADELARDGSWGVLIVGAGRQGRGQVDALVATGRVSRLLVFARRRDQAESLAEYARASGLRARATEDLRRAASASQVIVTITSAREPLLGPDDVAPGTLVIALGSDAPGKQELDPALLVGARVVVDIVEQAVVYGELQHAIAAGLMTADDVHAELGEIIAGGRAGRTSSDEIFVFDATGTAMQDVASARLLVAAASRRGLGLQVALDS